MRPIDADALTTDVRAMYITRANHPEDLLQLGGATALMDVIEKIDAQPTVNEWISVSERLPQDEQWVAALLYGFAGALRNPISLQYNAMKRVFIDEDGIEFDIDDVAYWVGLPELPEVRE